MRAINVQQLKKSYGTHEVLHDVSFHVEQGEIFALLGVNGAGKTTTLECLEGLRSYDDGTIQMQGRCGVQLQSTSLPKAILVQEALQFFAKWQRVSINKEELMNLGITPLMKKQYQQLSTGQKRRLHLAIAMLASPDILFLDEPTAGLDVEGRASLHQVIRKLKQQGKTIVLASHDMSEVETLCDRIALIKDGSILYEGAVDTFTRNDKHHVLLHLETSGKLDASMVKHCRFVQQDLHQCTFESDQLTLALGELVELVNVQQLEVLDIRVEHASLEQRFLQTIQEDAA